LPLSKTVKAADYLPRPPPESDKGGGEGGVKPIMPRLPKVLYYRFGYPNISDQINFCFDAVSTELMPTILVLVEYNPPTTNGLNICQFHKNSHFVSVFIPSSYKK
jgi:hypothetical protein